VRLLWSLPKAAPALLRHLAAYADLASLDLARARREFAAELLGSAIAAISGLFALFMGCLAVVALYLGHASPGECHRMDGRRIPGCLPSRRPRTGRVPRGRNRRLLASVRREMAEGSRASRAQYCRRTRIDQPHDRSGRSGPSRNSRQARGVAGRIAARLRSAAP